MKKTIWALKNKVSGFKSGVLMGVCTGMNMISGQALAFGGGTTTVTVNDNIDANQAMGAVIGIVLTIMRYVGVAMIIYGVYEVVMSIQNNQPEAKTKGIIMALSGVVMVAIKSLIGAFGINIS